MHISTLNYMIQSSLPSISLPKQSTTQISNGTQLNPNYIPSSLITPPPPHASPPSPPPNHRYSLPGFSFSARSWCKPSAIFPTALSGLTS